MIWLEYLTLISAILGFTGYLIQILMIVGCCDKHLNLQVHVFRGTVITMSIALISLIILICIK